MEQKKVSWKTNPVVGIVAVVLVFAVFFVGRSCAGRRGTPVLKTATFFAIDKETGDIFEMKLKVSELNKMPYKSEKTGRNTAYRALQCQKCQLIYPWEKESLIDNKCPRCNTDLPPIMLTFDPKNLNLKKEEVKEPVDNK